MGTYTSLEVKISYSVFLGGGSSFATICSLVDILLNRPSLEGSSSIAKNGFASRSRSSDKLLWYMFEEA